jgi:hypothetical protein
LEEEALKILIQVTEVSLSLVVEVEEVEYSLIHPLEEEAVEEEFHLEVVE